MRYYRSNKMSAVGDFVASVSGSGNDAPAATYTFTVVAAG
jgi:hypothetical protein